MIKVQFKNAFYISFMAEGPENSYRESYFNFPKSSQITNIKFGTAHQRKLVPASKNMPVCKINFAYNGKPERFTGKDIDLNIHSEKTNTQLANEIFSIFLKKVTKYSVIYIDGHTVTISRPEQADELAIGQHIKMKNGAIKTIFFKIETLVNILHTYIPKHAHSFLKIHLLLCNGQSMAKLIMEQLHARGFTFTSVVGYIPDTISFAEDDSLIDFSSTHRRQALFFISGYKHGRAFTSNKVTFHNYNNHNIIEEDYKKFKKLYLLESLKIRYLEEKLIFSRLYDIVCANLDRYKDNTKKLDHNFFHFSRKHSSSGSQRADYLNHRLKIQKQEFETSELTLISDISSIKYEKKFILELVDFTNKNKRYKDFPGSININSNSCLTYIFEALIEFFIEHQDFSNILLGFKNHLFNEYNTATNLSEIVENESHRKQLKRKLIMINERLINSWERLYFENIVF